MKIPDVYFVKWFDSQSDDGWTFYNKRKDIFPMIINTVGFLIYENKKLVRIALSYGQNSNKENKQFNETIIIPKCSIIKMKRIK
jgi:hypothetical protein